MTHAEVEALWMGKQVRQLLGEPVLIGRWGTVSEVIWDENDIPHARIEGGTGAFWCPISFLEEWVP